jgi:hypothetical protein
MTALIIPLLLANSIRYFLNAANTNQQYDWASGIFDCGFWLVCFLYRGAIWGQTKKAAVTFSALRPLTFEVM